MRIIELRHFRSFYIVFVNDKDDIHTLKHNKNFKNHAIYQDPSGRASGVEYSFSYKGTIIQAKSHVRRILEKEKKDEL